MFNPAALANNALILVIAAAALWSCAIREADRRWQIAWLLVGILCILAASGVLTHPRLR